MSQQLPNILTNKQRISLFLRILRNIITTSIRSTTASSFSILSSYNKPIPYKFIQNSSKLKLVNTEMIFEFIMKNFTKVLSKQVKFTLYSNFFILKQLNISKIHLKQKLLAIIRRISREQNLVYKAFQVFKNYAIESLLRKVLVMSGKQRAFAMRITFILLKPIREVFDVLKYNEQKLDFVGIPEEFALFGMHLVSSEKIQENLRFAYKAIRFVAGIKKVLGSKKQRARLYLAIKRMNRIALQCFHSVFVRWSNLVDPSRLQSDPY